MSLCVTYKDIEEKAIVQAKLLLASKTYSCEIAYLLPDAHFCMGPSPVGLALSYSEREGFHTTIISADAGCGVSVYRIPSVTKEQLVDLSENMERVLAMGRDMFLEKAVREYGLETNLSLEERLSMFSRSLCTIGGGNHFLEIGEHFNSSMNQTETYIVIHSGSRNVGGYILLEATRLATEHNKKKQRDDIQALVDRLMSEGKKHLIDSEIKSLPKTETDYVMQGEILETYRKLETFANSYATLNRDSIATAVTTYLFGDDTHPSKIVDKPHNYVDWKWRVLHKGSMGVSLGELVAIPLNMRDGTIVGRVNKNVEKWGYNLPHGAGRSKSRGEAILDISIEEYKEQTKGIISHTINEDTLDEAPSAYKDSESILDSLKDKLDDSFIIKPLMSYKEPSMKK
nr:MAG TPA: tRNA-splicing ligase RtcB [Caudoviricetes sp.]